MARMAFEITAEPGQPLQASAVLFAIHFPETLKPIDHVRALVTLHAVLREQLPSGPWVLPSIKGAFAVFPDSVEDGQPGGLTPHRHALAIAAAAAERGLALSAGITYGGLVCVRDFDGRRNLIGVPLNRAARLVKAHHDDGKVDRLETRAEIDALPIAQGMLLHGDYVSDRCGLVEDVPEWREVRVYGKRSEAFPGCRITPPGLWPTDPPDATKWNPVEKPKTPTALLLAFDLRSWSDGELHELAARFTGMRDHFDGLLARHDLEVRFAAPGGDGAVVGLVRKAKDAQVRMALGQEIAEDLHRHLVGDSRHRDAKTILDARIGVHYGQVALYEAAGADRPAGPELLRADGLAEEDILKGSGVALSHTVASAMFNQDEVELSKHYEELPPLANPPPPLRRWKKKA